jgi:hypothetical protein
MTDYCEMTRAFERGEVEPVGFSHADHVGVAWTMLRAYPFLTAAARYGAQIEDLARRAGAADKFNVTITLAFLSLIAERQARAKCPSAAAFLRENPDLLRGNPLSGFYSEQRLSEGIAREIFLLPDRAA